MALTPEALRESLRAKAKLLPVSAPAEPSSVHRIQGSTPDTGGEAREGATKRHSLEPSIALTEDSRGRQKHLSTGSGESSTITAGESEKNQPLSGVPDESTTGTTGMSPVPRGENEGVEKASPDERGTTQKEQHQKLRENVPETREAQTASVRDVRGKKGPETSSKLRQAAVRGVAMQASSSSRSQTVPQAPEIETAVLAALYQYPATCFPLFTERAKPEFFFNPVNRSFFSILSDYFTEHGQADPSAFLQSLLDSGQLDKHGGANFLSQLLSATSPPSALPYHLDILREKYVAREAFKRAAGLLERLAIPSESDLYSLIAEHEHAINDLATILASRNGHLSFRRVSEIFGMTFDDSDNYFGDRVIAAGQPCTLLGPGDIGKSRLSLQLAICMITGRDFLGMPTHAQAKTWLFIQSENSCRRLYDDLKNMLNGLELVESERAQVEEHLLIHTLENDYDSFLSLEDDKIYVKVNDLIQKVKPDVIDWDPLNSLTDEDLNADVDMRKVCMKISHVTKQGNISCVPFVVHHALTGKTGAAKAVGWEKSSYGRNSKVLHAWTRAQINLAPRSPDDSTLLIMSCGKNNNGKAFPEIGVQFNEKLGIYALDPNFDAADFREQVGIAASIKRIFTPKMIVDFHWPAQLLEKKELVKAFTDESGCGRSRAYELVEDAKKGGLIKFSSVSRLYSKR